MLGDLESKKLNVLVYKHASIVWYWKPCKKMKKKSKGLNSCTSSCNWSWAECVLLALYKNAKLSIFACIYVANTLKSATINILFLPLVLPTHKIRSNYLKSSHIMWRVFMFSFWGILILWIWIFSFFGNFTNQNSLQGRKLIITHR